ncbi:TM2 domain-containing protein [Pendulispora brunnea]|uniref:TM2 domain-containing protein n=1 Tax=Pendulispora brunnea TaxID=2905690 RepID=A0ABZ2KER4_9BACT
MQGGYPPPPGQGPNQPGGYGQAPSGGAGQNPYGGGYGPPPPGGPMAPYPGGPGGVPGAGPGAPYGVDPVTGLPFSDKSKIIAGILQLLVGAFGVGRFYTGHTTIAILQIVATWLTCGVGVIWPIVDGIMMLTGKVTDSQGRPLRDGT